MPVRDATTIEPCRLPRGGGSESALIAAPMSKRATDANFRSPKAKDA